MKSNWLKKKLVYILAVTTAIANMTVFSGCGSNAGDSLVERTVKNMTMDEKISQLIIPAIRTWNEEDVTSLEAVPELKEALRKHQYGGIILFGANIKGTEQITRLIDELQQNNMQIEDATTHVPYLMPVDEEGGIVIRLSTGTRMNGNMAIGATPDAAANAEETGRILSEEIAAVGFNVDYAPTIDVNNNPANPVIGTRSFSDDPARVAELGQAYVKGLNESNIIATYKHFPGHGDTSVYSHIGTPSVEKTYEEIQETELVPFAEAIKAGADMIMTAHITYPLIDEEVTFDDGVTKGYFPATMSKKMITDILRTDLGFGGVVVTDALEMDAIRTAGLVPGEEGSSEYMVNIVEQVLNAGVDMLLLPLDMNKPEAVLLYDDYIAGIAAKVEAGEISKERIDESVTRVLTLKEKYGIFDAGVKSEESDIEAKVEKAKEIVGSEEHHNKEMEIAQSAITVVKNDELLPLANDISKIEFLGRYQTDATTLQYAVDELKDSGLINADAEVSIDYYYDPDAEVMLNYTDDMKSRIGAADVVIGFSYASGSSALDKTNPQYMALRSAIEDTHAAGGKFILISENLPYDAAIFNDADAIVLAYLGSGLAIDPTEKNESGAGQPAINANIVAAIETAFGSYKPQGKLPVNIPVALELPDGTLSYGSDYLYERGYGLTW